MDHKRIIPALALLAVLLAAALLAWLAWQFAQLPPWLATPLRAAMCTLPLAAAGVGLRIAWRRWGTHQYIQAEHVTRLTRAQAQRFPDGLQHLSFHDSSRAQPPGAIEQAQPALDLAPPGIPPFAELLDQGRIGPGRPLLLGFRADDGQPIEGGWDALYSCGIGALPGAGKSWLAAFLLAQSAAQGGRLIVCDLHAGNPESLATRIQALAPAFMCDVASTPDTILSALQLAGDKLEQRRAGKGGAWDILLAIDEWTSLLRTRVGPMLPAFLEDVAEQGRKYHVNALLSAQGWTKDTAGVVRQRLTSHYVLRQRPDEARYQLGIPAAGCPLDVRFLPDATGYLLDVRGGLHKIIIPQMTSADLARVARLIDRPLGSAPAPRIPAPVAQIGANLEPIWSQSGAGSRAPGSAGAASPEAARAADLFMGGATPAEIVMQLRGVSSKQSGSRYQAALAEILELVRTGMIGRREA